MSGVIVEPFRFDDEDIGKCVRWLRDPEVVRYSEQRHLKHTYDSQVEYIRKKGENYCGIYIPHLIGTLSIEPDLLNNVAQVGIMIGDKSEWRKGYGLAAWEGCCNMLLNTCGIRKIEAGCMATNYGMISIFLKSRMTFEAYIPGHFLVDGEEVAEVRYGKFDEAV